MYYKNDLITKYAKNKVKIQFQKKLEMRKILLDDSKAIWSDFFF